MVQRVSLGLDRPKFPVKRFGNQVNSLIPPPSSRPIVPKPNPFYDALIFGIVFQEPFADAFKLTPPAVFIRIRFPKRSRIVVMSQRGENFKRGKTGQAREQMSLDEEGHFRMASRCHAERVSIYSTKKSLARIGDTSSGFQATSPQSGEGIIFRDDYPGWLLRCASNPGLISFCPVRAIQPAHSHLRPLTQFTGPVCRARAPCSCRKNIFPSDRPAGFSARRRRRRR